MFGASELTRQKVRRNVSIFEELCPFVGEQHCTGKKWGLEPLAGDAATVRIQIAAIITEVSWTVALQQFLLWFINLFFVSYLASRAKMPFAILIYSPS